MDDNSLLESIQKGDRDALDTLIKTYYRNIFAYFYRNTRDYHLSGDLTQDVFVKVVSAIKSYENRGKLLAWLYTIAANTLRNYWRREKLCKAFPLDVAESEAEASDFSDDACDKLRLDDALMSLPVEQREVIVFRYYHDMKIDDIAKTVNAPLSTVKSRLNYGLEKLKRAMGGR